ncbi:MAG TPA: type II 3-dehydroquinate dehydratase [Candidatus Omnitrophota bacterium]|nr:type II 3-dehydroquinate dehydratase [Candidatus Omnitrophota bacterium]HPT07625.1 type II 3-dehydroquinate dehydratase [Candidatus Omnitrophota bacterium]
MGKSIKKLKILIIHGPNLHLLGTREPGIYGKTTIAQINASLKKIAHDRNVTVCIKQSNHEGEIIDLITKTNFNGLLINPAAYTHTSVAIRDAIAASAKPAIEVHLSNIHARETFRHTSLISPVVRGTIMGFGPASYTVGLKTLLDLLST